MRRKHLILASCIISALLLTFTFHVSADENVTVDAGASSDSAPLLDSYFWDNYTLLPYIESSGQQYINTGIKATSDLTTRIRFSVDPDDLNQYNGVFGSRDSTGTIAYTMMIMEQTNNTYFSFYSGASMFSVDYLNYVIHDASLSQSVYFDGQVKHEFDDVAFNNNLDIYLLARNDNNYASYLTKCRIYSFSIYDSSLSDPLDETSDPVGYVRYYYPAKSNSGDVIGLYDAVSKTFVTTATNVPFANPTDDQVIHFQIGNFIESGLGWIGDILDFAIQEPMILMFMAIGLCGVAFRWARRVVHF